MVYAFAICKCVNHETCADSKKPKHIWVWEEEKTNPEETHPQICGEPAAESE